MSVRQDVHKEIWRPFDGARRRYRERVYATGRFAVKMARFVRREHFWAGNFHNSRAGFQSKLQHSRCNLGKERNAC